MRTIKFRGKQNSWIYGGISIFNGEASILDYNDIANSSYEVDIKTVGQFTGLTDKNGVEIYEGDIVKPNIKHITRNCQVVFDSLCFKLATKEWTNWFSEHVWCDLEVIGNIYENPELL